MADLQRQVATLSAKAAQLNQSLVEQQNQAREKLALLDDAKRQLADAFKALAADALKSSNTSFLELAKTQLEKFQESAKGDLEKRQTAIDELVKPVKESLGKVDAKLQEIEKSRIEAYSGLTEQVRSLSESQKDLRSETANLVKALRRPQARGRWGEIQLRRVVEMAGMLEHCDFVEQQSTDTEDGRLRPDMVVRLPGHKNIVVDSKAPLEAYLEAIEAPDDETRAAKFKDHARQVRKSHRRRWAERRISSSSTLRPEFVVLFLPGEVFFSAALENDPTLDRVGRESERHHRHADDADRAVAGGGLRLAAGSAGRKRQGHQRVGPGTLQTPLRSGRAYPTARQRAEHGGQRLQQRRRIAGIARVGQRAAVQGSRRRGDRRRDRGDSARSKLLLACSKRRSFSGRASHGLTALGDETCGSIRMLLPCSDDAVLPGFRLPVAQIF